jgi:ABC-type transport system substrate-binding protein
MTRLLGGTACLLRSGRSIAILLVLVALLTVPMASGARDLRSATRSGKTLTLAQVGDISSFDPSQQPANNFVMLYQIYDTLAEESSTLKLQPRLAQSWTFNRGQTQLTVHLRKGLHFSDGSPVTAADVVWNIQRYQDPVVASNIRPLALTVDRTTAPNSTTLVIHFSKPTPNAFDLLDLMWISKPAASNTDASIKSNPIGTGPFKLVQWAPGSEIVLTRNPYYWHKTKSNVSEVVIKDFPDAISAGLAFQSHQVDMVMQPSNTDLKRLGGSKAGAHAIAAGLGSTMEYIMLNARVVPLNDVRVRRAISLAVDRKAFVNSYEPGLAQPWCVPWRVGTWAYKAAGKLATKCDPDLNQAKALLASAGYANGLDLKVTTSTEGYAPGSAVNAQILQQNLAKIGVHLTIDNLDAGAARQAYVATRDWQVACHVYAKGNRDPATLFQGALAFQNGASSLEGISNSTYGRMIDAVAYNANIASRIRAVKTLTNYIIQQAFAIPVAPLPRTFLVSEKITGFAWNVDGAPLLGDVSLGG